MTEEKQLNKFSWYPGHIAKAERELKEKISQIDIIIELRDARIPFTSEHKDLPSWASNKTIITVLNKLDLADPERVPKQFLAINTKDPKSLNPLISALSKAAEPIEQKFKKKGIINRPARVMVVGYPNVGKSSLINALARKKKAKVENKPGVTRQQQWIDMQGKLSLKLLDTPGIIPAKFYSDDQALKLALCNCVGDNAFDDVLVAREMLKLIEDLYPKNLLELLKLNDLSLESYAKSKSIINNGELNIEKTAQHLILEFRNLKFGRISLD
jgi:ribosome biogenesis GTPase A